VAQFQTHQVALEVQAVLVVQALLMLVAVVAVIKTKAVLSPRAVLAGVVLVLHLRLIQLLELPIQAVAVAAVVGQRARALMVALVL
jgi:hypothetical protein